MHRKILKKEKKLSAIMIEMAETVLKYPEDVLAAQTARVSLFLATVAWNKETKGEKFLKLGQYSKIIEQEEQENPDLWDDFINTDYEGMIMQLRKYKRRYYEKDKRKIFGCGKNERGNIQIEWSY